MTDNVNTYYLNNRNKIINQSLKSYDKKIENMTKDELKEYRESKAKYFKQWYQKNRDRVHDKNKKRYISKPNKEVNLQPRETRYKKIEYEFLDKTGRINFSE